MARKVTLMGRFEQTLPAWACEAGNVGPRGTVGLYALLKSEKQLFGVLKVLENELATAGVSTVDGE